MTGCASLIVVSALPAAAQPTPTTEDTMRWVEGVVNVPIQWEMPGSAVQRTACVQRVSHSGCLVTVRYDCTLSVIATGEVQGSWSETYSGELGRFDPSKTGVSAVSSGWTYTPAAAAVTVVHPVERPAHLQVSGSAVNNASDVHGISIYVPADMGARVENAMRHAVETCGGRPYVPPF